MKKHVARSAALAASVLLALGMTACASESSEPDALAEQPAAAETEDNAAAEQPAEDFTEEELEGALVDSFPKEVPLYDGEIKSSSASISEVSDDPQWNVMMTTSDSLETVDASIRESFSANGWKIGTEMESGGGYLLVANGGGPTTSITYNDMFGDFITINYGVGG